MSPTPHRCPECGDLYVPGAAHECDVDTKFLHQEALRRRAEIDAELAQAREEMESAAMAGTLERWSVNATAPPCPDDDQANVSLPRLREFADWQRQQEDQEET